MHAEATVHAPINASSRPERALLELLEIALNELLNKSASSAKDSKEETAKRSMREQIDFTLPFGRQAVNAALAAQKLAPIEKQQRAESQCEHTTRTFVVPPSAVEEVLEPALTTSDTNIVSNGALATNAHKKPVLLLLVMVAQMMVFLWAVRGLFDAVLGL